MNKRAQSSSGYNSISGNNPRVLGGRSVDGSTGGTLIGPYGVAKDERRPQTSLRIIDKQSILWRDFQNGIKRRKRALVKLRDVAGDSSCSSGMLKRLLLEIRQMTLRIIEDSIEIEYKSAMALSLNEKSVSSYNGSLTRIGAGAMPRTAFQNALPPVTTFKGMEDKQDVLELAQIIDDVDDLFRLPNIQVFLPIEFPNRRNPFLLGKSVDELAVMSAPQPQPGNLEDELKVLEIMRYKRASKALLRAESQVTNRLPLTLQELEFIWLRMNEDAHRERLIRCVICLIDNDHAEMGQPPDLSALMTQAVTLEPFEFLNRLNAFKGQETMRIDVQVPVRKALRDCALEYMEDEGSVYLIEWVNAVLAGTMLPQSDATIGGGGSSVFGGPSVSDYRQGNVGRNSKAQHQSIRSLDGSGMYNMNLGKGMNAQFQQMQLNSNPNAGFGGDLVSLASSEQRSPGPKVFAGPGAKGGPIQAMQNQQANFQKAAPSSQESIGSATEQSTATSPETAAMQLLAARKPKKRKETEKEKKKRQKEELNAKINSEVLRILKAEGIVKNGGTDDELVTEDDTVTSLRYELVKMQQELLRRKVLDPRHYKIASVDMQSLKSHGVTVPEPDNGNAVGTTNIKKKMPPRSVPISERFQQLRDGSGSVEVVLDLVEDNFIVKLFRVIELDEDGNEVSDEQKLLNPNTKWSKVKEIIASMKCSKLMVNRLTGLTLEQIVDEKDEEKRRRKLVPVMDQMKRYTDTIEVEEVVGAVDADRTLLKTPMTFDNIAMDVHFVRNVECTGITLYLTPLTTGMGDVNQGPITMSIRDSELQILLINQRGLYLLSQSKWSCMEMVAQWLTSRIKLKRIAVLGPGEEALSDRELKLAQRRKEIEGASQAALVPLRGDAESKANQERNMLDFDSPSNAFGADFADLAPRGKRATMLDVYLDRSVEVSDIAVKQWRSRNLPQIHQMTSRLEAFQDMDMVRLEMVLEFPHPSQRKNKKGEFIASEGDGAVVTYKSKNKKGEALEPVLVRKNFCLTATELSIFGVSEALEERKISMSSKTTGESHPSAFMWNVLSRLKAVFKGSASQPFSKETKADDAANWDLTFDRRLLRDIRSISGGVMVVTASAVNGGILFDTEPTDGSIFDKVGSKLFTEEELSELAYEEAWPLKMLDYSERTHLAYRVLEKLKVVTDKEGLHRIELYNFPESKLLFLYQQNVPGKPDLPIGTVEINDHHTLADLRVIIRHEMDRDLVPRLYRFQYKGNPCAVRQEPFRRAWEVLPKAILIPRTQALDKNEKLAEEAEKRRLEMEAKQKKKALTMRKDQRRVPGNLVPVPIYTLCQVQEDSGEVYLLHDSRNLINCGDVIRIGHVMARDYIVAFRSKAIINTHPMSIQIEPTYDLVGEDDFDTPICGSSPTPSDPALNPRTGQPILPHYSKWGFKYDLPKPKRPVFDLTEGLDGKINVKDDKNRTVAVEKTIKTLNDGRGVDEDKETEQAKARADRSGAPEPGTIWKDVWIWKCIPPAEDQRPVWRLQFDAGEVPYEYNFKDSNEFDKFFRVKAKLRYMEILCTDVRCPDMTRHEQRVAEMSAFSVDYYSRMSFRTICDWYPQYKRGMESSKFMKLLRQMNVFPDIKRPQRVSQLDLMFLKEVKGDNGINEKYVNYVGYCKLLQDIALLRYPPPGSNDDDNESVGGSSVGMNSTGADSKTSKGGKSVGEKSLVSRQSKDSSPSRGGDSKGSKSKDASRKTEKSKDKEKVGDVDGDQNVQVAVDPVHAAWAYRKVVVDHVIACPEFAKIAWSEAKRSAMTKEAKKYCASTRIQAIVRGWRQRNEFLNFKFCMIQLQANIRRRQGRRYYRGIIHMLEQDWLFRLRYHCATKLQALVRRYLSRVRHYLVMKRRREEEVKVQKARRFRLKKIRQKEKKGIIYKEVKRVNGIMVCMYLSRKDTRNYSKDFGILIRVYVPISSQTFKFVIEEPKLRQYMQMELGVDAVGVGDLLDKRNLQRVVAARLIIRKAVRIGMPPQVLFSKQAMGQRGAHVMTCGKIIGGEFFVCKVYVTGDDLTVTCYHRMTCKIFTCAIFNPALRAWVRDDYIANCKSERERQQEPPILREDRKRGLYKWAVDHIRIDTRRETFKVLFENQLHKSRKGELIKLLQAHWRRAVCPNMHIRLKYDAFMIKVNTHAAADAPTYYVDRRTGESQWEKPKLLRYSDVTLQPSHRWEPLVYYHEGAYFQHFVNPWTGKYSHHTIDRAIRIMQACVRKKQLRHLLLTREELRRVVPFLKGAKAAYEQNPKRLMCVINYALVAHVYNLDEQLGKRLYIEAVDLAEANPLVTRAFGFFVLGTCEAPIQVNRERAIQLLSDAQRRDPEHLKFETAYLLYKMACIRNPKNVTALCNRALVDCYLYKQNWQAERLMRRALSIAPFEPRVLELWKYLRERFPDRQVLHNAPARIEQNSTSKSQKPPRLIHGRPAIEEPQWAGWVYIPEDTYKKSKIIGPYWYNPATGEETIKEPKWPEQWNIRRLRSQWSSADTGLHLYYDPLTAAYFHYHELTDTYD